MLFYPSLSIHSGDLQAVSFIPETAITGVSGPAHVTFTTTNQLRAHDRVVFTLPAHFSASPTSSCAEIFEPSGSLFSASSVSGNEIACVIGYAAEGTTWRFAVRNITNPAASQPPDREGGVCVRTIADNDAVIDQSCNSTCPEILPGKWHNLSLVLCGMRVHLSLPLREKTSI